MAIQLVGDETLVNSAPGDAGGVVSVAAKAGGSFLVTWEGPDRPAQPGQPRYGSDIEARAFAYEKPLGTDVVVNTLRLDPQTSPSATALGNGDYAVGYSSGDDDQVGGTYLATQTLDRFATKTSAETFSPLSYYHFFPSLAALPGGGFVSSATGEEAIDVQVHSDDGAAGSEFTYGSITNPFSHSTIVPLSASTALGLWQGYPTSDHSIGNVPGIYASVVSLNGSESASIFIAAPGDQRTAHYQASFLTDGHIAVVWSSSDETSLQAAGQVYLSIVDPRSGVVSQPESVGLEAGAQFEAQSLPTIATLADGRFVVSWVQGTPTAGDASGSSIEARVFSATGSPMGEVFQVNTVTTGNQSAPSVAALGDRFVIAWQGPDGIKDQIFDPDKLGARSSELVVRPGTQDGSAGDSQVLNGPSWANTFYFDSASHSGADTIANFQPNDVLVTSAMLFDSNHDGIVTFGSNGLLHIEGPGSPDTVKIIGVVPSSGLRYLGVEDGAYAYGEASVRPIGAIEGSLGDDTLGGDAIDAKQNIFFYDTALDLSLGQDTLSNFGNRDLLVTTTPLYDANGDGTIMFGSNGRLDLPGGVGGPDDSGLSSGSGGSLLVSDPYGHQVQALIFEGATTHDGVTYYAYGLANSKVSIHDLHFA